MTTQRNLNLQTCEYITLHGKSYFKYAIKLKILNGKIILNYLEGPNGITRVFIKVKWECQKDVTIGTEVRVKQLPPGKQKPGNACSLQKLENGGKQTLLQSLQKEYNPANTLIFAVGKCLCCPAGHIESAIVQHLMSIYSVPNPDLCISLFITSHLCGIGTFISQMKKLRPKYNK